MSCSSASPSPPAFGCHPKVTPFRLAFILIAGGLGITKAILVSDNEVASSITVEWVAGVVVALSFQFLTVYEYKVERSVYIDWIFSYDCLNILKALVTRKSKTIIGNPRSSSTLTPSGDPNNADSTSNPPPIVTVYRLLVSTSVSLFGIAKMLCAYLGIPTAMNTFDWLTAVPLTLGLYYMGLYEEIESSTPRRLFDIEYSRETVIGLYLFGGATPYVLWLGFWLAIFYAIITIFGGPIPVSNAETVCNGVSGRVNQSIMMVVCLGMLEVGVWGLCRLLWPLIEPCIEGHASSVRNCTARIVTLSHLMRGAVFLVGVAVVDFCVGVDVLSSRKESLPLRIIFGGIIVCLAPLPLALAVMCILSMVYF